MTETDIDRSKLKIGALGAVSVACSAYFGYALGVFSLNPVFSNLLILVYAVTGWMVFAVIRMFVVKSTTVASIISICELTALWAFLPVKFSMFTLLGLVLLFGFLFSGFMNGRLELANVLKIRFFKIGRRVLLVSATGIAILVSIYFLNIFGASKLTVPKSLISGLLQGSEPIVGKFIPGFALDASVDQVLESFSRANLPPGTPDVIIDEGVGALRREIAKRAGVPVSGGAKVVDVIYDVVALNVAKIPSGMKPVILVVAALLIFSFAKTVTFFLNWIILGAAYLIYKFLFAVKFMYVALETQSKEIVVVK